jgi:Calcineurin-like phosphoesterase
MYDFIGDIHGEADKLHAVLEKLGYQKQGGIYQHPARRVIFLGDFIDRGPKILEVLNIVIPMAEAGSALSIMGNHEYNYLAYHTPTKEGEGFLRPRNDKNKEQCQETLKQLSESENKRLLSWIWQLPLWIETESFRAVHACWDNASIETIKSSALGNKLNLDILFESSIKKTQAYHAIETLLKGKEVVLPPELQFHDKNGHKRTEARVCWWDLDRKIIIPPNFIEQSVYEAQKQMLKVPETPIERHTFFGHYWEQGTPKIVNPLAVCLDYSVADNGHLCAYRFDGESELQSSNLIWV